MAQQRIHIDPLDATNESYRTLKTIAVAVLFCLVLGSAIAFGELLEAAYQGPWLGGTRGEWASWRLAVLAYTVLIASLGVPIAIVMGVLFPKASLGTRACFSCAFVALMLSITICVGSGKTFGPVFALLLIQPTFFVGFSTYLRARLQISRLKSYCILLLAIASGVLSVRTACSLQFFLRDTSVVVSAVGLLSAMISLVVSTIAARGMSTHWGRAARTVSALAGATLLPGVFVGWPYVLTPDTNEPKAPNILLITADALRADYCSTFGGKVPTPNLTRLADSGTKFNTCYSAAPWTVPSLCSMFSAKYPPGLSPNAEVAQREHEQMSYRELASYWLEPDGTGSISQFKNLGYDTGAFCGNGAIGDQQWLLKQFDQAIVANALEAFGVTPFQLNPLAEQCIQALFPNLLKREPEDLTAEARHFAKVFLRVHAKRPFFLWIHFLDPHTPYDPPARFRTGVAPKDGFFGADYLADTQRALSQDEVRSLYGGEVQYMDEGVGEILDTLKELGLQDKTIVCFSADHGEELYDRGQVGHGHSMYNEVVHVPLIVAGPRVKQGTVNTSVSSIDIMPTLLSMLDKPTPASWQGQSMKLALLGLPCPSLDTPCFVQATHQFVPPTEPKQMVRDGQYKYVRVLTNGERLLFDETNDPNEKDNLVAKLPEVAARLEKELDNWQGTFPANFTAATEARPYRTVKLAPPDPEVREHLHALGYL